MNKNELILILQNLTDDELASCGLYRGMSCLSDTAIVGHMKKGNIIIDPFEDANLSTSSYDLRLGEYFWREQRPDPNLMDNFFNPYSKDSVKKIWGDKPQHAQPGSYFLERHNFGAENINPSDRIIYIAPGETILAHTEEFIGGCNGRVTSMMKARSSWGRCFITVCKCAGWGDVNYINRWTLEITNNSRDYGIPLLVGMRIAQLVFFNVEQIRGAGYGASGKYQTSENLKKVKSGWSPEDMLPRIYNDREIRAKNSHNPSS